MIFCCFMIFWGNGTMKLKIILLLHIFFVLTITWLLGFYCFVVNNVPFSVKNYFSRPQNQILVLTTERPSLLGAKHHDQISQQSLLMFYFSFFLNLEIQFTEASGWEPSTETEHFQDFGSFNLSPFGCFLQTQLILVRKQTPISQPSIKPNDRKVIICCSN